MKAGIIIPIFFYTNVIDEIETENGPYANSPSVSIRPEMKIPQRPQTNAFYHYTISLV